MDKLSRLLGVLACAAVVATAGCASNSSSPATGSALPATQSSMAINHGGSNLITEHGVTYLTPHYMQTRYAPHQNAQPDILLNYGNGPVLQKPKMYLIFWGYKSAGDPDAVKALMINYAKSIGGSGYNNIYTQYYGPGTVYIKNPAGQYGGSWSDNTNAVPLHPTDAQVAQEALNGIAHFTAKHPYNINGSYVVLTPHGHSSSGFGTQWCAYHSATSYNGKLVSYTNMPYTPDAGQSCGANIISPPGDESGVDEGMTIVEGHEYGESVTDPNPPQGWYNGQYGEIGDICAWQNIQNDPFKTNSYTAQPMFSNASQSCVHSY